MIEYVRKSVAFYVEDGLYLYIITSPQHIQLFPTRRSMCARISFMWIDLTTTQMFSVLLKHLPIFFNVMIVFVITY